MILFCSCSFSIPIKPTLQYVHGKQNAKSIPYKPFIDIAQMKDSN